MSTFKITSTDPPRVMVGTSALNNKDIFMSSLPRKSNNPLTAFYDAAGKRLGKEEDLHINWLPALNPAMFKATGKRQISNQRRYLRALIEAQGVVANVPASILSAVLRQDTPTTEPPSPAPTSDHQWVELWEDRLANLTNDQVLKIRKAMQRLWGKAPDLKTLVGARTEAVAVGRSPYDTGAYCAWAILNGQVAEGQTDATGVGSKRKREEDGGAEQSGAGEVDVAGPFRRKVQLRLDVFRQRIAFAEALIR